MKKSTFVIGTGVFGACLLLFACSGTGQTGAPVGGRAAEMMPVETIGQVAVYKGGRGQGQSVIFVHGTPGSASAWNDYLDDVPEGMDYVAIDRPGFGASEPKAVMPLMSDQALALEPLLPTDGGRAILVGHSLGGPIIAKAAVLYPQRVGGLVILAGSLDPSLEKIHWIQHIGRWWPISKLIPSSLDHSNREIFALERELEILGDQLDTIDVPVIIIHGTKDRLVPYENVAFMEERMTGARLEIVTLEGQNHFLPWNSKAIVDDAIMRLSKSIRE